MWPSVPSIVAPLLNSGSDALGCGGDQERGGRGRHCRGFDKGKRAQYTCSVETVTHTLKAAGNDDGAVLGEGPDVGRSAEYRPPCHFCGKGC